VVTGAVKRDFRPVLLAGISSPVATLQQARSVTGQRVRRRFAEPPPIRHTQSTKPGRPGNVCGIDLEREEVTASIA
jgi:hypothetical protein